MVGYGAPWLAALRMLLLAGNGGALGFTGYGALWLAGYDASWFAECGRIGVMLSTEIGRGGFGLMVFFVM